MSVVLSSRHGTAWHGGWRLRRDSTFDCSARVDAVKSPTWGDGRTRAAAERGDLEAFTAEQFDGFSVPTSPMGQGYVRGLLTDGRRKSVEPLAARLGEDGNRRALAHFVALVAVP